MLKACFRQNHRTMKKKINYWRPFILLFILLNGLFVIARSWLAKHGADSDVLIAGNLVLVFATSLSFWVSQRSVSSTNPHAAVRSMYGSFMIKFFVCIIAAFVYILAAKKNVNKPALFICMGLYLVYTFIEVSALTRMMKKKKNA
jgi:hypothetical protein